MGTALSPRTVIADSILLAAAGVLILGLGAAGWAMFIRTKPAGPPPPKSTSFTHLHCPSCGDEIPYSPEKAKSDCSECNAGMAYVPTNGSIRKDGPNRWHKPIAFAAIVLVLVPGFIYVLVRRLRVLRRRANAIVHQHLIMPCPFCSRKVSYPESRAGTGYVCSGCKTAFALEAVMEDAEAV